MLARVRAAASIARAPTRIAQVRHMHVSPFDRLILTAGSAITGFIDPARGDMIAMLGELTGEPALRRMRDRMRRDRDGAWLLEHRPRIRQSHVDVAKLHSLPEGTFGRAYASYLSAHGFSPEERAEVRLVRDPELAYVMQRYREVHDFWHVLAGLPPSVLGETAVKWLEMVQTGLPMCALSAFVAPLRLSRDERRRLVRVYAPWAAETGRSARDLMTVRYEDLLELPLDEVRTRLNFKPAPAIQP
jgi:ubiquinone biosynthesis protein COQ4